VLKPLAVSVPEAAQLCSVPEDRFRREILPYLSIVKIGATVRIMTQDLEGLCKVAPMALGKAGGRPDGWRLRELRGRFYVRFRHEGKRLEFAVKGADPAAEAQTIYDRFHSPPPDLSGPGVYALRFQEYLKIGCSEISMHERCTQIARYLPEDPELLGGLSANPADESKFLQMFAPLRTRGEWFRNGYLIERILRKRGFLR